MNLFAKMTLSFVALYTITIDKIRGNIQSIEAGDVGMSIGDIKPASMIPTLFIFFAPNHLAATAVCHINCT